MNKPDTRKAARWVLDQILPPTCCGCGVVLPEPHALCGDCWGTVTFLGEPCCNACGHPFEYEIPEQTLCGRCISHPPAFDRARSAVEYNATSKDFILAFKHADATDMAQLLGKWMKVASGDLMQSCDVIIPVPLHWTRLLSRRYNQSAMLALALSKITGKPVFVDALVRHRKTKSQGHLGMTARKKNVNGAFRIKPKHRSFMKNKRILLIDDVYTTGATVNATAKVLKRAGAVGVDVLTVARVVKNNS